MNILIAGGGIGGLSAALSLAKFGHNVTVLEQASAFEEVGAGLQISPNGMKVLRELGLSEAVRSAGFEPEQIELRFGESGQTIFNIPLKVRAIKRWGAPFVQIHRADLLHVLAEAAEAHPNIRVVFQSRVERFEEMPESVRVMTSSNRILEGDLLIGADGIHSTIREQMFGQDSPEFTGCVAWRGVVNLDQFSNPPPPNAVAWVGRGKHAVTYRLRQGRLVNFVGVVEREDWRDESWSKFGMKDQIRKDFEGWHSVIRNIIEQGESFFQWGLFGRAPLNRWSSQRVTLLGDSVHPMLPFLAQGAVMAIEDGWVLAKCLDSQMELSSQLTMYEQIRRPRTSKVQKRSLDNKTTFHHSSELMRAGTYGPMWLAGKFMPEFVHSRMDWIYGHDVI